MINFNTIYTINNGQESIEFKEGKGGTVTGEYNDGSLTGTLEGNFLKATYHNKKTNGAGLIEITFHEKGFDAKWKQGLEPGPMRGKWEGVLSLDSIQGGDHFQKEFTFDVCTGIDELSKNMKILAVQSKESREEFCKELIVFTRKNQEFLWLIPAYFQELNAIEWLIDDGEIDGDLSGFYTKKEFLNEMSTKIFSNQCLYYNSRNNLFAWNDEDDTKSLFNLILEDLNLSIEDLMVSYNSEYKSDGQRHFIKFINMLRTVLYASIVRAFYSEEYDDESIGYLITSPYEDENVATIESQTNGFGDALNWAIEDVLYCLNVDLNSEEYDEEWGNYSKNYEKMAEAISLQESYDNPLIEI